VVRGRRFDRHRPSLTFICHHAREERGRKRGVQPRFAPRSRRRTCVPMAPGRRGGGVASRPMSKESSKSGGMRTPRTAPAHVWAGRPGSHFRCARRPRYAWKCSPLSPTCRPGRPGLPRSTPCSQSSRRARANRLRLGLGPPDLRRRTGCIRRPVPTVLNVRCLQRLACVNDVRSPARSPSAAIGSHAGEANASYGQPHDRVTFGRTLGKARCPSPIDSADARHMARSGDIANC
jgi:hypothetical protein